MRRGRRLVADAAVCAALAGAMLAPAAATAQNRGEVIAEIRIHGNHTTPDAEILQMAGVAVGQPFGPDTIRLVGERLRRSGRFETVEVRKRYRSLADTAEIALVIVVQEHPVPDIGPPVLRPFRRVAGSMMFLPILDYVDGYGATYGGRITFVGAMGRDSRLSVPLTWGGTKRAAVEIDRTFREAPVDLLSGGAAISRRTNPYFRTDLDRQEVWGGARRRLGDAVSVAVRASHAAISFADLDDRLTTAGGELTLDTRIDPAFPRNAVLATVAWDVLDPRAGPRVHRLQADARGFVGLSGQSVLSMRWQYGRASGPLPPYERFLLGGMNTLRGYRAGSFAGDNLMAASAELRLPVGNVLRFSQSGFTIFADVGSAYPHGVRLADTRFRAGAGAGVFLLASLFRFHLEVGVREHAGTRVHVATSFQF